MSVLASVLAAMAVLSVDRSIATAPVAPAPLVADAAPRRAGTPELLYVNFDGGVLHSGCGNEAHYNCSTLADTFDGYVGPFTGNETQRISILQATRKTLADFGVRVVVDRPPEDEPYTMVMYGDLGQQSFAGLAPYIDCEDVHQNDTSFTAAFDTSNTGSTVILQEAAHTWGLEHVDSEFDVLNPFKSAGIHQEFLDECEVIVANTDLQPTPGSCNIVHTRFCDEGHQNSWQEMRYLFGPPVPDTSAPTLEIVSPLEDETFVLPTTIPLTGDITDDLDPQFYAIEIHTVLDGVEMEPYEESKVALDLLLTNPPPGDYEMRVVIADEAGNKAEDTVVFTILPEGSELPEPPPEVDDDDHETDGCRIAGGHGRAALAPVLVDAGDRATPPTDAAMSTLGAALWLALAGPDAHPLDADVPPQPPPSRDLEFRAREVGTGTTMYVNFDGIDLGECSPSNSKKNCSWYNFDEDIPPFSGSLQTQVSVMQAIRRDVADFGVRVTGLRPPGDQNYVMVVYGGTEAKYGALGSAPSGDCLDQNPNEVAFAHLDGSGSTWVNGGATTALHEAAHTWGLDHVDLEGDVMYPASDNSPTAFADGCHPIVEDTDLTPGGVGCPEVNTEICGAADQQDARPLLTMLFGPAYVDVTRPTVTLAELEDGQYFQTPATFDVVLDVDDDLHPQTYEMWAWLADDPRPEQPTTVLAPGFAVDDLPVGSWTFHVVVADEAGQESEQLDFTIEVGVDPPPVPEHDGGCRVAKAPVPTGLVALVVVGPLLLARPRRRR